MELGPKCLPECVFLSTTVQEGCLKIIRHGFTGQQLLTLCQTKP